MNAFMHNKDNELNFRGKIKHIQSNHNQKLL